MHEFPDEWTYKSGGHIEKAPRRKSSTVSHSVSWCLTYTHGTRPSTGGKRSHSERASECLLLKEGTGVDDLPSSCLEDFRIFTLEVGLSDRRVCFRREVKLREYLVRPSLPGQVDTPSRQE